MINFKFLNIGLVPRQLMLLFFLLCCFSFGQAGAAYPNFQNTSTTNKSAEYTKDTIQINNLILSPRAIVLSSPAKSIIIGEKALKMAAALKWVPGTIKTYTESCTAYWYKIEYEQAYEYYSKSYHQSLGTNITNERIELLNTKNKSNIRVTTHDLYDEENCACGTLVTVNLTVNEIIESSYC